MYMARAKRLRPIDDEIRLILLSKSQESDLNQSGIGALSSLSQNRVGIIFRGETPPATVGEVSAIATALGTTASAVVRQAEDALEAESNVLRFPATSRQENQREADAMLAEQRYAASQLKTGEKDAPQYPDAD